MLQLSDIITDEELGSMPFVIRRRHYILSAGETILVSTEDIPTSGTVHPTADADLSLVPEEYRSETLRTFYAPVLFSLGVRADPASFSAPDLILYAGRTFLVIAVKDWSAFGFSKAIAVEKAEP